MSNAVSGSDSRRVLSIMAHPDDAEILIGGTLLRLRDLGWSIGMATMTPGNCGSARHSAAEISRIRLAEAEAAARSLGGEYFCLDLRDAEVFANAENVRRVAAVMRRFDPDVVITHSPVDYMADHEETSRLARAAAFAKAIRLYTDAAGAGGGGRPTPALYYADPIEGAGPLGERILPQFYIDVADCLPQKRELLACHASQREWLRQHHGIDEYLDRMTEWAAAYGKECGAPYAQGLRQHLGHGYPREPVLQRALAPHLRERK